MSMNATTVASRSSEFMVMRVSWFESGGELGFSD